MQQLFNDLIKQDVKPLLSKHGFAKKSLSFSKPEEIGRASGRERVL